MTAGGHGHGWRGRWPGRVLRFPLTRIVLGFLAIIVVGNLEAETSGADLLSGGSSGLDGSVFAVTLCLTVVAALLVLAHRRGRFRPPFWHRWRAS